MEERIDTLETRMGSLGKSIKSFVAQFCNGWGVLLKPNEAKKHTVNLDSEWETSAKDLIGVFWKNSVGAAEERLIEDDETINLCR